MKEKLRSENLKGKFVAKSQKASRRGTLHLSTKEEREKKEKHVEILG